MVSPGAELTPVRAVGADGGLGLGGIDVASGLLRQLLEPSQGGLPRATMASLWSLVWIV